MRIIGLFLFIIILSACNSEQIQEIVPKIIYCDAEKQEHERFSTSSQDHFLGNANQQSNITSLSGSYSLLTTKDKPYGFTYESSNLFPDEYYYVSVWCKGDLKSAHIIGDGIGSEFYKPQKTAVADSNGWSKIELNFYLPPEIDFEKLKIYVWNNGDDSIFFDDFTISNSSGRIYPEFKEEPLQIIIDTADLVHLKNIRLRAFRAKYIITEDDSYVKAQIIFGTDTLKGKIRFKGDFFAHLEGEKWSFRVKLKKKYSWNGMNTFSLHTPAARDFLAEKILHDFCRNNDLLATRYGFVPVSLNGKNIGVYAFEEHFKKEMVESLNRKEGVIIKSSEDEYWFNNMLIVNGTIKSSLPYYKASAIVPFQENKVAKNKYLFDQFEIAQDLMYQFRYATKPASEIFEVDKLAKFMAIMDVMGGYHGIHWHNLRFYYNPVSMKLEPIAFDNYTEAEISDSTLIGHYFIWDQKHTKGFFGILNDEPFVAKYLNYLDYYSTNFHDLIQPVLDEVLVYETMIQKEFPYYKFNRFYTKRIEDINDRIEQYGKFIKDSLQLDETKFFDESEDNYEYYKEIPDYLVKVYTDFNTSTGNIDLNITNYFNHAIELSSYTLKDSSFVSLDERIHMAAFESAIVETPFKDRGEIKMLNFETKHDRRDQHSVTVFPWRKPGSSASLTPVKDNAMAYLKGKGLVNGNTIFFKAGNHLLDQTIIIPAKYRVVFNAGAKVDIVKGAAFISYSPVEMNGQKNSPVVVKSTDGTAMGFTLLQTTGKNRMNFVVFDQINTLNLNGWTLTGAVNCYESNIEMSHVSFINNRCEDALNIIKSEFVMNYCLFDNIYADAFDSDFSKGELTNSEFRDIGNDAIDFSGSNVTIRDCKILTAADKGISGGENSNLTIENITIENVNIGIASKDKSSVKINNGSLENCNYGIVVFMKKPVYGPATAEINGLDFLDIGTHYLIEKNSSLLLNGEEIQGSAKSVADLFYVK